ncbi:MAG: YwmB family TATA-box binding protein [Clostridia bacterium]|nr:YwmB family TATA-box binding protein [Clostridia bacterium]
MKKWFCIIAVFVIVLSGGRGTNNFSLTKYFIGDYFCYTEDKIADESINLGPFYETAELKTTNPLGESMVVENFEPLAALETLDADLISTEIIGSAVVMYAYTPLIKDYKLVAGNKINLQIANYDNYSVIGWPLILGSF